MDLPTIRQFDGCMCRITIDGKKYFLAPYNITMPFGAIPAEFQNTTGAEIAKNISNLNEKKYILNFFKIPAADSIELNGFKKRITVNINSDDSVDVSETNDFYGNVSVGIRTIALKSEEEQLKYFEQSVAEIENNAELKDYSFSENKSDTLLFSVSQSYTIKDYILSASDRIKSFRVPGMNSGGFKFSDTERNFDIKWRGYEFSNITATINFPENYEVYFVPTAEKLQIANMPFEYKRNFTQENNRIIFESDFFRKTDFLEKIFILNFERFMKI